jgi:hypothetical protein
MLGCEATDREATHPDACTALASAVTGLLTLDPDSLDDAELADAVVRLHRHGARLAAATARLTAAMDTRRLWADDGSRSCGAWLAHRCRLPIGQARARAWLGRRLRSMPATFKGRVCELADRIVITPGALASLLDEALIERVVFDGPSRVIDVGRARRFSGAVRRALDVLDRGCTHEGCDMPAERCQGDHVQPWSRGGHTDPDNGQLRCAYHNRWRWEHGDGDPLAPPPRRPHPKPISNDARHGSRPGAPGLVPACSPGVPRDRTPRPT